VVPARIARAPLAGDCSSERTAGRADAGDRARGAGSRTLNMLLASRPRPTPVLSTRTPDRWRRDERPISTTNHGVTQTATAPRCRAAPWHTTEKDAGDGTVSRWINVWAVFARLLSPIRQLESGYRIGDYPALRRRRLQLALCHEDLALLLCRPAGLGPFWVWLRASLVMTVSAAARREGLAS
jgi:hypothetical protein